MSLDNRLKVYIEKKCEVCIFLTNGVKLKGIIHEEEKGTIFLVRDKTVQDIFKHSISTIMPPEGIIELEGNR